MTPITRLLACISIIALSGCTCFDPKHVDKASQAPIHRENPEIANRCSPVRDLLAKNYRRERKVDVLVAGAGTYDSRTGAILSNDEAARVAHVDSVCRAWVYGEITGKQYAATLLGITSAAILEAKDPAQRQATASEAVKLFEELRKLGILPPEFAPAKIPERVAEDARLTESELRDRINAAIVEMDRISRGFIGIPEFQRQVLDRFTALETSISQLREQGTPRKEDPPGSGVRLPSDQGNRMPGSSGASTAADKAVPPTLQSLTVYFSTNSAELSYEGRRMLRNAAAGWAASGSIVDVVGFADPRGSGSLNDRLSRGRANEVAALLKTLGVKVSSAKGAGVERSGGDLETLRIARIVLK